MELHDVCLLLGQSATLLFIQLASAYDDNTLAVESQIGEQRLRYQPSLIAHLDSFLVGAQPVYLDHHQSVVRQSAACPFPSVHVLCKADALYLETALPVGHHLAVFLHLDVHQVVYHAEVVNRLFAESFLDVSYDVLQFMTCDNLFFLGVFDDSYFHSIVPFLYFCLQNYIKNWQKPNFSEEKFPKISKSAFTLHPVSAIPLILS